MIQTLLGHHVGVGTKYTFRLWRPGLGLIWVEQTNNVVTIAGRNDLLDRFCKTIPASVNKFIGLKGPGIPSENDTAASHPTWSEITTYDEGSRPAFTPGTVAAGAVNNAASKATYSINADGDIYGGLMIDDNTKGGGSGVLYGVVDFASGAITNATQANPCVITSTGHGLVTGNRVRIDGIVGMTELNNRVFTITSLTADTFSLDAEDSTGHTAYTSGGVWSKVRAAEAGDTLDIQADLSIVSL